MTTIYTYYQQIPGLSLPHQTHLLILWCENWKAFGYEPRLLTSFDAQQHPLFKEYDEAISKLPSVNNVDYEKACYHRWLAMAQVGGGIMADYDVFPVSREIDLVLRKDFKDEPLTIWQDHNPCPSLVTGAPEEFERIAKLFMNYKLEPSDMAGAAPHTSDQNILQKHHKEFIHGDIVKHYRQDGWLKAWALHLSNGNMVAEKKTPRHEHVPSILEEHKRGQ